VFDRGLCVGTPPPNPKGTFTPSAQLSGFSQRTSTAIIAPMTVANIGVSPEVADCGTPKIFGGPTGRDLTRATWLLGKGEQLHVV